VRATCVRLHTVTVGDHWRNREGDDTRMMDTAHQMGTASESPSKEIDGSGDGFRAGTRDVDGTET
jgi:hypothetical protein